MSAPTTMPLAITGCGVITTAGIGLDALRARLDAPVPAHPVPPGLDAEGDPLGYPDVAVHALPEIRVGDHIGRKGTRRLDRLIGLGLVAGRHAIRTAGLEDSTQWRDHAGVTVGTATGSIRSLAEIATDTLTQDEPWMIAPSRFPNTVLNSCAGQLAIWNGLRGVNATVAGGQLSGLSALRYATNAIRVGQASTMIVGGVEELGPHLAWAWHRAGVLADGAALGEGCALFVLEPTEAVGGRPVAAELLGTEVGFCGRRRDRVGLAAGLATCITRALERAGVSPFDVDVVAPGASAQRGTGRIEQQGVRSALGRTPDVLRIADVLGETYSASVGLQVAAVLSRWTGGDAGAGRHALVTSMDRDGNIGCLLLRRPG